METKNKTLVTSSVIPHILLVLFILGEQNRNKERNNKHCVYTQTCFTSSQIGATSQRKGHSSFYSSVRAALSYISISGGCKSFKQGKVI